MLGGFALCKMLSQVPLTRCPGWPSLSIRWTSVHLCPDQPENWFAIQCWSGFGASTGISAQFRKSWCKHCSIVAAIWPAKHPASTQRHITPWPVVGHTPWVFGFMHDFKAPLSKSIVNDKSLRCFSSGLLFLPCQARWNFKPLLIDLIASFLPACCQQQHVRRAFQAWRVKALYIPCKHHLERLRNTCQVENPTFRFMEVRTKGASRFKWPCKQHSIWMCFGKAECYIMLQHVKHIDSNELKHGLVDIVSSYQSYLLTVKNLPATSPTKAFSKVTSVFRLYLFCSSRSFRRKLDSSVITIDKFRNFGCELCN